MGKDDASLLMEMFMKASFLIASFLARGLFIGRVGKNMLDSGKMGSCMAMDRSTGQMGIFSKGALIRGKSKGMACFIRMVKQFKGGGKMEKD
jgi:hypothetical protein